MTAEQEIWIRAYCSAIETKATGGTYKEFADTALKSYQETFKARIVDLAANPKTKKTLEEVLEEFKKQPWQFTQAGPLFVHSQVCPICKGKSKVRLEGHYQTCPKCNGERTIPMIQMEP